MNAFISKDAYLIEIIMIRDLSDIETRKMLNLKEYLKKFMNHNDSYFYESIGILLFHRVVFSKLKSRYQMELHNFRQLFDKHQGVFDYQEQVAI